MPRARRDDSRELPNFNNRKMHPWARYWRHRDGSVTHRHYNPDGSLLSVTRNDTPDAFPGGPKEGRKDA